MTRRNNNPAFRDSKEDSDNMRFHDKHRNEEPDDIKPIDGLSGLIPQVQVIDYLLAGKAIITVKSLGERKKDMPERITYKVACKRGTKPENCDIWFINVLTGSNNNSDYTYLGFIKVIDDVIQFRRGKDSRIGADAPSCIVWDHVFKLFALRKVHPKLEVYHEGRCVRCGRRLTDDESIRRGMGSECAGIIKKWRPLRIVESIKKGKLEDYNKLLENRTDVTLTEEQLNRAAKLTKGHKLLQRNNPDTE